MSDRTPSTEASVHFEPLDPELPGDATEEEWADHYAHKCELMRHRVVAAADWLEQVGNDYPGSSCQQWCSERATALRDSLKAGSAPEPRGERRPGRSKFVYDKAKRTIVTVPTEPCGEHQWWMAGDPDCPSELKAPNGELHTLRCKVCGGDSRTIGAICGFKAPEPHELPCTAWDSRCCQLEREVERLRAKLSGEPGAEERAFAWGWRLCANWAKRDDLIADIGSPAYLADMRAALTKGKKP